MMPLARPRWLSKVVIGSFAAQLVWTWLSMLPRGVWEDGWFVKRFAYNFRHHLSFSWNVDDGPLYGMTSQTLQFVGAALSLVTPEHLVLALKASLWLSLFATLLVLARFQQEDELALLPAFCGLSCPVLFELLPSGLETPFAMLAIALSLLAVIRFRGGRADGALLIASLVFVYVTRPDAVLIPVCVWLGLALGDRLHPRVERPTLGAQLKVLGLFVVAMAATLGVFKLLYGTALPLPFYVKTHGLNVQEPAHVAIFAREKTKNSLQFCFWCLPFVYVALHHRVRQVWLLLASAFAFCAYHFALTIEEMGHHSRFYFPALVPVLAASVLAWPAFMRTRRWWVTALFAAAYFAVLLVLLGVDREYRVDIFLPGLGSLLTTALLATFAVLTLPSRPGAAVAAVLLVMGVVINFRLPAKLALEDDETILLRQIHPRLVFRNLEQIRKLKPAVVFHTDMGAPGVLLPNTRVVDINGLLNREMTLQGVRFQTLCMREAPEAIYAPNATYPRYREEVLSSECMKNYTAVTPMDGSPLFVRNDLLERFRQL